MADNEDDDDWGDFNTAAEDPDPAMNGHAEPAIAPSEDDDFGDFATSSTENKSPGDALEVNDTNDPSQPPKNGDAQETDANALVQADPIVENAGPDETADKTGKSESSSLSNYETAKEDEDDEFGDFDGPASGQNGQSTDAGAEHTTTSTPSGDDTQSRPTDEQSAPENSNPNDESFGDFNEPAQESSVPVPENSNPNDDSFGDFNEPSAATKDSEVDPVATTTAPETAPPSTDDDDWGDFGGFNGPSADADSGNNHIESKPAKASPLPENATEPATKDENDGADFGDFSAPESSTPKDDSPPIESKETEESFGDFNEPDANANVEATPAPAPEGGDDDWGDFGDFNGGADASEQPKPNPEPSDNATPAAQTAPQTADDGDDEFGDFGDFDGATDTNANQSASNDSSNKVAKAEPQSSEFGANFEAQRGPPSSQEEQDPLLQKAKTILSKVFEGYKTDVKAEETESGGGKMAVSELLSSISSNYDSKSNEALVQKFEAALQEIHIDEPPPKFIVAEGETFSPNSQYAVRIDGESGSRSSSSQQAIASMPQQLWQAQNTGSSADQPSRSQSSQQTQAATMVELPPQDKKKPPSDTAGDQLSQKAQQLLKQIPDLSFMLQSSLRLPSKTK